jgi:hypothetical protein
MGVRGLLSKRICNRLEVREAGSGGEGYVRSQASRGLGLLRSRTFIHMLPETSGSRYLPLMFCDSI